MKTNWREIRESMVSPPFDLSNLKNLKVESQESEQSASETSQVFKVNKVKSPPLDLESRLDRLGIRVAKDLATGVALLIFSDADAEAVCDVAKVYKPFAVTLTGEQRRELTASLDYYDTLNPET